MMQPTHAKFGKWGVLTVVLGAAVSTAASAQTSAARVSVGNGAPLLGTSSSAVGVGVLTPQVNGNPNSVRILGSEKTAGLSTNAIRGPNGANTEVQVRTPVDGVVNGLLPR
jgi:hypothetical protein